jgi:hypothetical protein
MPRQPIRLHPALSTIYRDKVAALSEALCSDDTSRSPRQRGQYSTPKHTCSRQTTDVVLQALLIAVWRLKPKRKVLVHSDQG